MKSLCKSFTTNKITHMRDKVLKIIDKLSTTLIDKFAC